MRFRRTLLLLLASLASSALAQTRFCIAGDLDHLNETQVAACKAKTTDVREAAKRHGVPAGWHFVVVCDETGWKDYAGFMAPFAGALKDAAFHTDEGQHLTFLRGSRMDAGSAESADTLLTVALKGVPTPKAVPLPNPKRVLPQPTLTVASVEAPRLP